LLQAPPGEQQIRQAEEAVRQAEAAVAQNQVAVQQGMAAVAEAEAGVAQAAAALEAAEAVLAQMTLRAPFAGTLAHVAVETGEVVTAGAVVAALADMEGWLVETESLLESDVVAVTEGQAVDVRLDAFPGHTLPGTVTNIAAAANIVRGDVTYTVTVRLDDTADLPLRWGMTAFVDIH
jgi:multidrug resistance efflux pump